MLGPKQEAQAALSYEFCLKDHIPQDHIPQDHWLRSIDWFVDLSDNLLHLAPFYSSTERPSIAPEFLIRMLLVGYLRGWLTLLASGALHVGPTGSLLVIKI